MNPTTVAEVKAPTAEAPKPIAMANPAEVFQEQQQRIKRLASGVDGGFKGLALEAPSTDLSQEKQSLGELKDELGNLGKATQEKIDKVTGVPQSEQQILPSWEEAFKGPIGEEFRNAMRGESDGTRIHNEYTMREFVRKHPKEAGIMAKAYEKQSGQPHSNIIRAISEVAQLQKNPIQVPPEDPKYADLSFSLTADPEYQRIYNEMDKANKLAVFGTLDFKSIPRERFAELANGQKSLRFLLEGANKAEAEFRKLHPDKAQRYREREPNRVYRDPDGVINPWRDPAFQTLQKPNSLNQVKRRDLALQDFAQMYPDKAKAYATVIPELQTTVPATEEAAVVKTSGVGESKKVVEEVAEAPKIAATLVQEKTPEKLKQKTAQGEKPVGVEDKGKVENSGISAKETMPQEITREAEIRELLKHPQDLQDTAYVLLTLEKYDLENVRDTLTTFLRDRKNGQNAEMWETRIKAIREQHQQQYGEWRKKRFDKYIHDQDELNVAYKIENTNTQVESEESLYCVHCADYVPQIQEESAVIPTTYQAGGEFLRTTVHVSLNHAVEPVDANGIKWSWDDKRLAIIAPFQGVAALNGYPEATLPEDTWWGLGIMSGLKLPKGTMILVQKGDSYTDQLHRLPGVQVIETDSPPYHNVDKVMEEHSIPIIRPGNFQGQETLSRKWHSFNEQHSSGTSGYGGAERILSSSGMDKEVVNLVERFNQQDYPGDSSERVAITTELLSMGYFQPPGYSDISIDFNRGQAEQGVSSIYGGSKSQQEIMRDREEFRSYCLDELRQSGQGENNWGSQMTDMDRNRFQAIRSQLEVLASNMGVRLPRYSEGYLTMRIGEIKDRLETIPPKLLGAFISEQFRALGLNSVSA